MRMVCILLCLAVASVDVIFANCGNGCFTYQYEYDTSSYYRWSEKVCIEGQACTDCVATGSCPAQTLIVPTHGCDTTKDTDRWNLAISATCCGGGAAGQANVAADMGTSTTVAKDRHCKSGY